MYEYKGTTNICLTHNLGAGLELKTALELEIDLKLEIGLRLEISSSPV